MEIPQYRKRQMQAKPNPINARYLRPTHELLERHNQNPIKCKATETWTKTALTRAKSSSTTSYECERWMPNTWTTEVQLNPINEHGSGKCTNFLCFGRSGQHISRRHTNQLCLQVSTDPVTAPISCFGRSCQHRSGQRTNQLLRLVRSSPIQSAHQSVASVDPVSTDPVGAPIICASVDPVSTDPVSTPIRCFSRSGQNTNQYKLMCFFSSNVVNTS